MAFVAHIHPTRCGAPGLSYSTARESLGTEKGPGEAISQLVVHQPLGCSAENQPPHDRGSLEPQKPLCSRGQGDASAFARCHGSWGTVNPCKVGDVSRRCWITHAHQLLVPGSLPWVMDGPAGTGDSCAPPPPWQQPRAAAWGALSSTSNMRNPPAPGSVVDCRAGILLVPLSESWGTKGQTLSANNLMPHLAPVSPAWPGHHPQAEMKCPENAICKAVGRPFGTDHCHLQASSPGAHVPLCPLQPRWFAACSALATASPTGSPQPWLLAGAWLRRSPLSSSGVAKTRPLGRAEVPHLLSAVGAAGARRQDSLLPTCFSRRACPCPGHCTVTAKGRGEQTPWLHPELGKDPPTMPLLPARAVWDGAFV